MTRVRSITVWLSAMALVSGSGCAVKDPPPPNESLTSVFSEKTAVPAAWKAAGGEDGVVNTDWVQTFADAQLEALIVEGLFNNLDLKAAAARVDVASAIVVQARSLLYPQFVAVAGVGAVGRDSTHDRSSLAGELSWELDLWGRVRSQAASATAARTATEADLLFARQSLSAMVATVWYQAVATERLRLTAEESAGIYEELLRLVRTKNELGQIGRQDVALAGADLDRARHRERSFATSGQQIARGL